MEKDLKSLNTLNTLNTLKIIKDLKKIYIFEIQKNVFFIKNMK